MGPIKIMNTIIIPLIPVLLLVEYHSYHFPSMYHGSGTALRCLERQTLVDTAEE